MFFLRYFGTDPQAFAKHFDLFEILEGQLTPPGQRGIMINRLFRERRFKNRIAYTLDKIDEAREDQGRTIQEDEELQQWVARNIRQYRTIMMELDGDETKALSGELALFFSLLLRSHCSTMPRSPSNTPISTLRPANVVSE